MVTPRFRIPTFEELLKKIKQPKVTVKDLTTEEFDADQALQFGYKLPAGWKLKRLEGVDSLISPRGLTFKGLKAVGGKIADFQAFKGDKPVRLPPLGERITPPVQPVEPPPIEPPPIEPKRVEPRRDTTAQQAVEKRIGRKLTVYERYGTQPIPELGNRYFTKALSQEFLDEIPPVEPPAPVTPPITERPPEVEPATAMRLKEEQEILLTDPGLLKIQETYQAAISRGLNRQKAIEEAIGRKLSFGEVLGGTPIPELKGMLLSIDKGEITAPMPYVSAVEGARVFGEGLIKLPQQLRAAILQAFQGKGGASVVDRDWADRFIADAQTDLNKFVREVQEEFPTAPFMTELAQFPQNLAFSITSMGAGLAVGVPIAFVPLPYARVAAYTFGTAASGYVAYNMTTYQIMQQYLEFKNEESIANTGKGITAEEEKRLKADFESKAHRYGLWEAIPEAISNLAFVTILTQPLTKIVGREIATRIIGKIVFMYGQELLTETITQKGQAAIEFKAGMREEDIDWGEAFREIFVQTFLLTTFMAGAGQAIISSTNAVKKARASLKNEATQKGISEDSVLYSKAEEEIVTRLEGLIPETARARMEARAELVPEEVPEVAKPPVEITERGFAMRKVGEMEAEVAGLKEWLATEPATKLVRLIKKAGWRKGEISNLTIAQYKKITGRETVPSNILTADKKHVQWEYALDSVATEMGYESGEALREGIERVGESLVRIKSLEAEIPVARTEAEAPIGIRPEVEIQEKLTAVQKIRRQYQGKIKSYDQTKKALVDYVNKNLPLAVRGKMLASVKNVKTELGLTRAINRTNILAEYNAQKELRTEIRKEIKRSQATIKDKILKGKFTPDTQRRLDILRHNLELDRDQAREKIASNINQYDEGKLSYEEMLEANEALNFAGIKGMSSEELTETLDYIRSLKDIGRSERQAKIEKETERIRAIREDIIGILTDGKGLKPGVGTVSRSELEVTKGWLEKLVNWQYSWDNFMDKLSKFDKVSAPYQSKISVFGKAVHYSRSQENVGSRSATEAVRENFMRIFETTKRSEINQILNRFQEDKINLGTFKNLDGVEVTLQLTKDQIINKYQQLQDPTLEGTFIEGMRWTDEIKQAITNNLSDQERAWADWQMEFYQEYYEGINKVYTEIYGVDLPHNLNYSPIKRDLGAEIRENVLTFQDAGRYASVLNGSLKSRVTNKIPLRFNGSTGILINHITQMEHFKAWAETMRDMRRVFGNKDVRTAIRQYHGAPILKTIDGYLNDMARGGIERALINRGADFLRRNFARSILSIKPVIGLKQIPSVLAYTTEMPIGDFVTGVADFWSNPLVNYRFLIEHSDYALARFGLGHERDIKFAMRRTPVGQISGKTSVVNWFLLQIRLGDKFAATQGMWAKYKSVMKGKAETAENIDMAMREAQISTDRTQPSFDLETLSPLQKGGSWLRLLTMFQNQPNKYFRIMADNVRNFQYGRGNRAVRVRNILLVWVILPCLFQFIADAFQFKPERQARAVILGPLNWILIFGPFAQSVYGWVTDEPFDYQASPVMQTSRDIQTAVQKTMKLIKQGQDPYQNISVDDAIAATEYFTKAAGELLGYPTPWLVQAERGVRTAITKDEPERYWELMFSRWALESPRKGANEKVNELLDGLGLPVEETVKKPLTGKPEEIYDMADLNSDIKAILGNTIPSEITAEKGFSPLAVAWAEKEQGRSIADTLPNIPLYKINTDTEQDDTILQYYKQWKARERIDNLADLREFDKLYPKAYLGNVTRQQYSLLVEYLEAEDKDAFLANHPELRVNRRNEWLEANPKENGLLAIWGQAKLLSEKAYNEFQGLLKELGIPEDAIPTEKVNEPPEGLLDLIPDYFSYSTEVQKGTPSDRNLWEAYFTYYALPSGSYLSMTQSQVDVGFLPEEYKAEWEAYQKLKTDTARTLYRKRHREAAYGNWRKDFRRANPEFDQWLQDEQGLKPLPKKAISRTARGRMTLAGAGVGFTGGVARPRRAKVTYPKFKRPKISTGMTVRAPRVPAP